MIISCNTCQNLSPLFSSELKLPTLKKQTWKYLYETGGKQETFLTLTLPSCKPLYLDF